MLLKLSYSINLKDITAPETNVLIVKIFISTTLLKVSQHMISTELMEFLKYHSHSNINSELHILIVFKRFIEVKKKLFQLTLAT